MRREKECAVVDSREHKSVVEYPQFYDDLFAADPGLSFPSKHGFSLIISTLKLKIKN